MLITDKRYLLVIILWAILANTNFAFAGTSQIFSPAGLPRSNNQNYSIPETTVPTQTFPTPPLPLRDIGSQGFSSIPFRNEIKMKNAKPVTQEANTQTDLPLNSESAKVESFFQVDSLPKETPTPNKNTSAIGGAGKVIWHILDNMGIPMVIGKDNDLDPSLRKADILEQHTVTSQTTTVPFQSSIPHSEFGVSDLPLKDNAKLP